MTDPLITHYLVTHTRNHVYREQVRAALTEAEGNVTAAAQGLGLTRRAVYMAIERFKLDVEEYRKVQLR